MEHATAPAAAAAAAALLLMLLLLLLQLLLLLLQLLLLLLLLLLDMGRHDTTRAKVRPSSGWGWAGGKWQSAADESTYLPQSKRLFGSPCSCISAFVRTICLKRIRTGDQSR